MCNRVASDEAILQYIYIGTITCDMNLKKLTVTYIL